MACLERLLAEKKPFLSKKNAAAQLRFEKLHLNTTTQCKTLKENNQTVAVMKSPDLCPSEMLWWDHKTAVHKWNFNELKQRCKEK